MILSFFNTMYPFLFGFFWCTQKNMCDISVNDFCPSQMSKLFHLLVIQEYFVIFSVPLP